MKPKQGIAPLVVALLITSSSSCSSPGSRFDQCVAITGYFGAPEGAAMERAADGLRGLALDSDLKRPVERMADAYDDMANFESADDYTAASDRYVDALAVVNEKCEDA